MTQNGQREERLLFAFDPSPEWASALRKVWDRYYQDERAPTSLVRHVVQEFVLPSDRRGDKGRPGPAYGPTQVAPARVTVSDRLLQKVGRARLGAGKTGRQISRDENTSFSPGFPVPHFNHSQDN